MSLPPDIAAFLKSRRVAVAGVSRQPQAPANAIFRKLKDAGLEVVPVNPKAAEVEGVPCYPDVASIPGEIDGVMIATHPGEALAVVQQCAGRGVKRVWFHRSFGTGSVSSEALAACKAQGIAAIEGGCPLMYCEPVDPAHRCFRWFLKVAGRAPR